MLDPTTIALALASGALIGAVLGLVGGGGSILAVPLLVHVVGIANPHRAIGTAAIAVALNALGGLFGHARKGTVKWRCGLLFAAAGVAGAFAGAEVGKSIDGNSLLALFGLLMIVVGLLMFFRRTSETEEEVRLTRENAVQLVSRLVPTGLGVGFLSGFFGIGGGFLIVPGLMLATAMPIINAVGTSLLSVTAFGTTTAGSYALSGLVDWQLAAWLIAGGAFGSIFGILAGRKLSTSKRALDRMFATLVMLVGAYVTQQAL